MARDFLDDRRTGLEEAFFAKQNEMLRQRLRQADEDKAKREALAAASGINDPAVLDSLGKLGIGAETLAALSLVPVVAVAWADGSIDERERSAILQAAEGAGVGKGGTAYPILEGWLRERPPPAVLDAWKGYVRALSGTLDSGARDKLKADLLGRARTVAEATGGFMGLGHRVSAAERAALDELERAFAA